LLTPRAQALLEEWKDHQGLVVARWEDFADAKPPHEGRTLAVSILQLMGGAWQIELEVPEATQVLVAKAVWEQMPRIPIVAIEEAVLQLECDSLLSPLTHMSDLDWTTQACDSLGHECRCTILRILRKGPLQTSALQEALGIPVSTMRHHLKKLLDVGFISDHRDGTQMSYAIQPLVFLVFLRRVARTYGSAQWLTS